VRDTIYSALVVKTCSPPSKRFLTPIAGFLFLAALSSPARAAETPIPNLTGTWGRAGLFHFEPPASGAGPVTNTSNFDDRIVRVGDYTNPILTPQSAQIVKERGDEQLAGINFPDPRNQCAPEPPPFLLAIEFEVQVLQKKDEILILYRYGHQVRHIRLNGSHPTRVTPSSYGDSIGHFEGDTLVVDTVGVKTGPLSMVDIFGTPHSEALHLIERYRLIKGEEASKAAPSMQTPLGGEIDPDTNKNGLQIEFTVDDKGAFAMPWSARVTYRPLLPREWMELVCAENPDHLNPHSLMPTASKPDF
jgi:hypothetical protein